MVSRILCAIQTGKLIFPMTSLISLSLGYSQIAKVLCCSAIEPSKPPIEAHRIMNLQ